MASLLGLLVLVTLVSFCASGTTKYFCQFFNDGKYWCYTGSRSAKSDENASPGIPDAYGKVGTGEPVSGSWKNGDTPFEMPNRVNGKALRKYVGSCSLAKDYQCKSATPPCPKPIPNGPPVSCQGPKSSSGSKWTGTIGGSLKIGS